MCCSLQDPRGVAVVLGPLQECSRNSGTITYARLQLLELPLIF